MKPDITQYLQFANPIQQMRHDLTAGCVEKEVKRMKKPRKAKNCGDCLFHEYTDDDMICEQGHKPRFYKPDTSGLPTFDYGWRRRCEDFIKEGK